MSESSFSNNQQMFACMHIIYWHLPIVFINIFKNAVSRLDQGSDIDIGNKMPQGH